jgi:four helix bundle protein
MSSTDFKQLSVWQKSKDLAVDVYKITSSGNISKDYGFIDQIRRAAVSIPSNIAEGNDRESQKEFLRFLYVAKGSLAELQVQLEIAKEIHYIDEEIYSDVNLKCIEISKMLGGLIKSIKNNELKSPEPY